MNASTPRSNKIIWTGRIIKIIVILFLLMDAGMKIVKAQPAIDGTVKLGLSVDLVPILGIILIICTGLYALPRTALLGAVLLTAYLGGAVAIMIRVSEPFYFPIIFAILAWLGIYFSGDKLKALLSNKNL